MSGAVRLRFPFNLQMNSPDLVPVTFPSRFSSPSPLILVLFTTCDPYNRLSLLKKESALEILYGLSLFTLLEYLARNSSTFSFTFFWNSVAGSVLKFNLLKEKDRIGKSYLQQLRDREELPKNKKLSSFSFERMKNQRNSIGIIYNRVVGGCIDLPFDSIVLFCVISSSI